MSSVVIMFGSDSGCKSSGYMGCYGENMLGSDIGVGTVGRLIAMKRGSWTEDGCM